MQLKTFKTLWGNQLSIDDACDQAISAGFSGIEGQAPSSREQQIEMLNAIKNSGSDYIAEIVTGGDYVPNRNWTVEQHLDDLKRQIESSLMIAPLFATCITGCDAWEESQSIDFFQRAIELSDSYGLTISFETHRSRSLFNPWTTLRIIEQLPNMKLTADISHWCVVCERLMDSEIPTLEALSNNVHHIHGRVGYDQGPQVPNPAAPEYADALKSHQGIWEMFWTKQYLKGYAFSTLTPEFGPDGYLHLMPFTQKPVADLWEVNQWMGATEREHFKQFRQTLQP
ncbi:sugar phosphate isomerase/epimerase family protein [Hydrogenovibrio kuenenii]|uniref:sugar phosphate isomerase/epimerase family protein n=1 Tax=Hydrogenovibrio kuenenii TaxID=63658 RepID=UPI000464C9BD|nr:sugar phosphate isomerase/epimerase [Hydrogenovibrio kuenenii]